jgi:L-fuconolactonase
MPRRIDAHHHFWKYDPAEYDWINDQMSRIRRDFLPADLHEEMRAAGISGAISVQARQTLEETRWLLELAGRHHFILGVVGWVPLTDPKVDTILADLTRSRKLRGVRHVLQDEPDPFYLLRDDFNAGIRALRRFKLTYDILIFERHLPQTIEFVDNHPDQIFVVDHLAKPRVRDSELSPWRENLHELAKRPNTYCKLSGLVTEANYSDWSIEQLTPYVDAALSAFSPNRLMFGSDWPVCLVAIDYPEWAAIVASAISGLSPSEQERIWSGTAQEAYRI